MLAGAWIAVRQYRLSDRAITLVSFVLLSTPVFLLAVLLKIGAICFQPGARRGPDPVHRRKHARR